MKIMTVRLFGIWEVMGRLCEFIFKERGVF